MNISDEAILLLHKAPVIDTMKITLLPDLHVRVPRFSKERDQLKVKNKGTATFLT